jgi:RNA polymerase-binding transcription factor
MGAKKIRDTRRQLSGQYDNLIKSINRKQSAAEDIRLEKTKDESDLASISHDRDLLYTLHESDFARLRFIEQAMTAIDRGQYGKCARCGEDINDKRLEAVPWAKMCIGCQEETEAEHISPAVMASLETEVPEW